MSKSKIGQASIFRCPICDGVMIYTSALYAACPSLDMHGRLQQVGPAFVSGGRRNLESEYQRAAKFANALVAYEKVIAKLPKPKPKARRKK